MMTKKAQAQKGPENKTVSITRKKFATRSLGVFLLAISLSMFAQGIPLMFVFIGAYLGVPTDATVGDMDTMVWLLTSVAMLIVAVYVFITWIKFLWRRFIAKPRPLFQFQKKEKHA